MQSFPPHFLLDCIGENMLDLNKSFPPISVDPPMSSNGKTHMNNSLFISTSCHLGILTPYT